MQNSLKLRMLNRERFSNERNDRLTLRIENCLSNNFGPHHPRRPSNKELHLPFISHRSSLIAYSMQRALKNTISPFCTLIVSKSWRKIVCP